MSYFVDNHGEDEDNNSKDDIYLQRHGINGTIRSTMAKECAITGKRSQVGGGYSNEIRATKFNPTGKRRRQVNLQKKSVFVPELKKSVTITASTKGFKTIKKNGAFSTLKKAGLI